MRIVGHQQPFCPIRCLTLSFDARVNITKHYNQLWQKPQHTLHDIYVDHLFQTGPTCSKETLESRG